MVMCADPCKESITASQTCHKRKALQASTSITAVPPNRNPNPATRQEVLFPAYTLDYRVVHHGPGAGFGMLANRDIKKGENVLTDSVEFLFADVQEGDCIRLVGAELCSHQTEYPVPHKLELTHDMLSRTHGVPLLLPPDNNTTTATIAGYETWRLEVPWMLINHSCDPNCIDSSHKEPEGEAIAARDIKKGEELTYDYAVQYYDATHSFDCLCGSGKCRGRIAGFQGLSPQEKVQVMPRASEFIQAMHLAEFEQGPPIVKQQVVFPTRTAKTSNPPATRVVCPGPSCSAADIKIKQCPVTQQYSLFAMRDFVFGECVYEYWNEAWPSADAVNSPVDMVAASDLLQGDAKEGTTIRLMAATCGAARDSLGRFQFTGYDLLTVHCCEPNIVYNYKVEVEDDDWRSAYACRPIQKGEKLSIDWNAVHYDRTEFLKRENDATATACSCGAFQCRGTNLGFRWLAKENQEELLSFSWRRLSPLKETSLIVPGEALSPHIRVKLRKQNRLNEEDTETGSTCSSTSNDEPSSCSEDPAL